jgi:hypothetical protein
MALRVAKYFIRMHSPPRFVRRMPAIFVPLTPSFATVLTT